MSISKSVQNAIRSCLPLCLGLLVSASLADTAPKSQVFIYLEVPDQIQAHTQLTLESLELLGDGLPIILPVQGVELAARELAGKQILLGIVPSNGTTLDQLNITLNKVSGTAGVAPVKMDPMGMEFSYEIDFFPGPGQNQCLFLAWNPKPLPEKVEDFKPRFSQRQGIWPPLGSALFVSCPSSNSLMVADYSTLKVEGSLQVGKNPRGMVFSPFTQKIYAVLKGGDGIAVIHAPSCRLEQTIPLNFGDEPTRVILAANQTDLLILNSGSRTLVAISTSSNQEIFRIPVGNRPRSLAQDPETGWVYVACEGEGEIQVIDPALPSHQGAVNLTTSPAEIIIDHRSRILLVSSSSQRRLFGWDLESGVSFSQINLCGSAVSLAFDHRSNQVYCGHPDCRSIGVFHPETGLEFPGIHLPAEPGLMTFDSQIRVLAVAFPGDGRVALINAMSGELMKELEAGPDVYEVLIP